MKKLRLILNLLLLILVSSPVWAETVISLNDSLSLGKNKVLLEDIAKIKSDLSIDLKKFEICKSPALQQRRVIDKEYVRMKLKQAGIDAEDIKFKGSDSVIVFRKTRLLEAEMLIDFAREHILSNLNGNPDDYIIEPERMPKNILVADSLLDFEVLGNGLFDRPGVVTIMLKVNYSEDEHIKVPVNLKIRKFAQVVVTKRLIERKEIISAKDLTLRKEELVTKIEDAFFDIENLVGKRAKTRINSNYVVVPRMVEVPDAVKRRSIVTLIYETNSMKIVTKVQASENGRIGDIINVINPSTKKEYSAQIIGLGLVQYVM